MNSIISIVGVASNGILKIGISPTVSHESKTIINTKDNINPIMLITPMLTNNIFTIFFPFLLTVCHRYIISHMRTIVNRFLEKYISNENFCRGIQMFTEIFVQILQERNITAYQISKSTNISKGLLSEYKSGIKKPTIENLIKLADYLDVSVDYLLGRTDKPEVNR